MIGAAAAAAVLLIIAGLAYARVSRQRNDLERQLGVLAIANQELNSSLADLKNDVRSMNARISQQADARPSQASNSDGAQGSAASSTPRRAPVRTQARATVDPRVARLQSQVAEQEKELSSTRDELNKTREGLESNINSTRDELNGNLSNTRDELNGSIARTHDDIVALQKRGERNYYEFQLSKSKDFSKIGPVSISLRKANTKRKSFDVAMVIDDVQLQKKSVNLFEPVWINLDDRPQPVELVVNQISKDQIQGYISEPKYKRSELGETTADRIQTQPKALEARP